MPPLSDDVQLTVEQYRAKLYEMIMAKKLERRARRKEVQESRQRATAVIREPPPAEPAPMDKDHSPALSPHPMANGGTKYGDADNQYGAGEGHQAASQTQQRKPSRWRYQY